MGFLSKLLQKETKPLVLEDTSPVGFSYHVAYTALPVLAFDNMERIKEIWRNEPTKAGAMMFKEACSMCKLAPPPELTEQFIAKKYTVGGLEFYLLIHPKPGPIDYRSIDPIKVIQSGAITTLAPYFSCAAYDPAGDSVKIFVLGQAATGDGTTLRTVTSNGINGNLGPGPEASVDHFLEAIWQR